MNRTLPEVNEFVKLTATNAFTRETVGDDVFIEGWATTETINAFDQIVKANSFKGKNGFRRFNGRVLSFHDQSKAPIGQVEILKIVPGQGLWVRIKLFGEAGPLFHRNVEEGMLNAFSIGFRVLKYEFDEKTQIITFTECELQEISVVNIGANEEALFEVVHGIMGELPDSSPAGASAQYSTTTNSSDDSIIWTLKTGSVDIAKPDVPDDWTKLTKRSNSMSKDLKPGDIDPSLITLDMFTKEKDALQSNLDDLKKLQADMATDLQSHRDSTMSTTDFLSKMDRMSEDVEKLADDVEKGLNAVRHSQENVFQYQDYRSMLKGHSWLVHEDGKPYTDVDYRAHALFQMPVDYDKFERGQELRNIRTLHDAVKILDAQRQFSNRSGGRYRLDASPIWKQFTEAVNKFDHTLAHAMAGGNAGFGAEWVPESFSAEFNAYLRLIPSLPNKFRTWNMPPSSSGKYPFQNGRAVVYAGSENLVDSGAQARKTNIATGATTFTPILFIGALVTSEILTEDTILDLVALIRMELATAIVEALESALINGDTAGTHQDNVGGATHYQTYDVASHILGLRALAFDNGDTVNTETITGDTGIGAQTWECFTEMKGMLGRSALTGNLNDTIWITGVKGRNKMQNALLKEDALGILNYMTSGVLPQIDGSDVYVSGMYNEDLDDDGLGHGTLLSGAHTSWLACHTPSFRIAQRSGITLEVNKDILTQQQQFVATARYDFGTVSASDVTPVVNGYNVQYA